MRLISRSMYETIYLPGNLLRVGNYHEENHVGTFYYFRLGATEDAGHLIPVDGGITLEPRESRHVWSLESFHLSAKVLGLFGGISSLIGEGLQLVNSPSIDPGFTGLLELAIINHRNEPVQLPASANIGKVLFFDVSDSVIDVDDFLASTLKQAELRKREELANPSNPE